MPKTESLNLTKTRVELEMVDLTHFKPLRF